MSDCDHIIEIQAFSPHEEHMGPWTREVKYRTVKIWFDKEQSVGEMINDKLINTIGKWQTDMGHGFSNWPHVALHFLFCPKCGEKLEPKAIEND